MRKEGRFVVDAHVHITTLYKRIEESEIKLGGGYIYELYDNSPLCLYDMDNYGVDMCVLLPSWPGTLNEWQAKLVDRYPDKFAACCSDQTLRLKCARGEAQWTIEAALEEVEAALKTGKFVGIGEFIPRDFSKNKVYTFRERLDECRQIANLAAKYNVALLWHEYDGTDWGGSYYAGYNILRRIAAENRDVNFVIQHGGYSGDGYLVGTDRIRMACNAARGGNVYLECGNFLAEYYEIPLKDPNVGATQLIWTGGDYGNCPQYIFSRTGMRYLAPSGASGTTTRKFPITPKYQTDWWGWCLHEIRRLKDRYLATQDEINLILGGNAAKVYKLKVPHPRMFPCGRPDLNGILWNESIPFLPADQIQNPDTPQPYFDGTYRDAPKGSKTRSTQPY